MAVTLPNTSSQPKTGLREEQNLGEGSSVLLEHPTPWPCTAHGSQLSPRLSWWSWAGDRLCFHGDRMLKPCGPLMCWESHLKE